MRESEYVEIWNKIKYSSVITGAFVDSEWKDLVDHRKQIMREFIDNVTKKLRDQLHLSLVHNNLPECSSCKENSIIEGCDGQACLLCE